MVSTSCPFSSFCVLVSLQSRASGALLPIDQRVPEEKPTRCLLRSGDVLPLLRSFGHGVPSLGLPHEVCGPARPQAELQTLQE